MDYSHHLCLLWARLIILLAAVILTVRSAGGGGAGVSIESCNLCDHNFTIILATGRSGSTTVLTMVNQLPGFDIGGEHAGQFHDLLKLYGHFKESQQRGQGAHGAGAWANQAVSETAFLCWIQGWYFAHSGSQRNQNPNAKVHGFKEIRYNTPDVLQFLVKVFPCGKFIVNYRQDLGQQHQSKFHTHTSLKQLQKMTGALTEFSRQYPRRTFAMPLEQFANVTLWNSLVSWLGKPNCEVASVAWANNDSYVADSGKFIRCNK
jgi:hypothetical protein